MPSTQSLQLLAPILFLLLPVAFTPAYSSVQAAPTASSFTFAFAGDFSHYQRFQANMDSLNQSSAAFFLALGDLAYGPNVTTVEQSWCSQFKASFDNVEIITGNHDSGEDTYGSIQKYVQYCPWTLPGITIAPGVKPGYGYGYEYYFDYPEVNPLARFIMISPGINFTTAQAGFSEVWKYNVGDQHYDWVNNTIDSARSIRIPWVIVGMHKPCLVVATVSNCSSGTSIMNLLLSKKVDLVINGHMHMYARSKQLSCATNGLFSPGCVANDRNFLAKGAGTVMVTSGTGGQTPLDNIDPAKIENMKYFATENNDTTGYSEVKVSTESLQMQFVPTTGAFTDSFTIQQSTSDFSLSITQSLNLVANSSVRYLAPVTVAGWNGFTGNVTLFCSILPSAGLEVTCNPGTVELNMSRVVAYSACVVDALNAGPYAVNITGTSGSSSHSVIMTVVAGSMPSDFTIATSPAVSFNANTTSTSTIIVHSVSLFIYPIQLTSAVAPNTGLNVSLSINTIPYGSGASIATFRSATPGTYAVTIFGNSGVTIHSTHITVQVTKTGISGDFAETVVPTLIVVQPTQNGTSTVHLVSINEFSGSLSLSTLVIDNCIPEPCFDSPFAPHAFLDRSRVSLAPGTASSPALTIQVPNIPYSKPVNFTAEIVVSNGTLFHNFGLTITVEPNPDFTIASNPSQDIFFSGETSTAIVLVAGQYGFTGTVKLTLSVTPSMGLDAVCTPTTIQNGAGSSTCALSSSYPGSYAITATGTSGEITHSTIDTVTVAKRNTTTSVSCSPTSVAISQESACTAGMTDASPGSAGTPTGTVSFTISGATGVLDATNCTLVTGSCTVTLSPTANGTITVTGSYSGDQTHVSSSGSSSITASSRQTSTTIFCSPASIVVDNIATCIATVADISAGTQVVPTGTVSWTLAGMGTFNFTSCALRDGRCSVTFTPFAVETGFQVITGSYSSDSTHYGSFGAVEISVQDFTLSLNPAELDLTADSAGTVFVRAVGLTGFQGQVVVLINPVNEVSCNLGSTNLTVSTPVTLTCASKSPGTYVVVISGTYGLTSRSTQLTLNVLPYRSPSGPHEQSLPLPFVVYSTIGGLVFVGLFLVLTQRVGKKRSLRPNP